MKNSKGYNKLVKRYSNLKGYYNEPISVTIGVVSIPSD